MGPGLQLSQRLTQSLVLAPQLQQSLALLQAPSLELKALVEQELQQNPVLEEVPEPELDAREKSPGSEESAGSDEAEMPPVTDFAEPPEDLKFDAAAERVANEPVDDFQAEFEKLVQMDQDWRDHFSQTNTVNRTTAEDEERREFMFNSLAVETSLAQHLMEQVRDTDLSGDERAVAELLIGNVDDYGYLMATGEELAASANLPVGKISHVLKTIQSFEPARSESTRLNSSHRL